MPSPLDHQCPECQTGLGGARAVTTIADGRGLTVVTMICRKCGHGWKVEQLEPGPPLYQAQQSADAWGRF
jgi:RNase P subunit RPR2